MHKASFHLLLAGVVAFIVACEESPTTPLAQSGSSLQIAKGKPAGTEYDPHLPSQMVSCNLVDNALAKIPRGDGIRPVTDSETAPSGRRYNGDGRSFVTFGHTWDGSDYVVDAGRSNVGANTGIINDYPAFLDLPQDPVDDQLTFKKRSGEITISGGALFNLPGHGNGQVRVNMRFVGTDGGDRIYQGCAKTPQLTNFGFTVQEGGDFVQQEYFKAWARADADGNVLEYEWTEISTFKNVRPGAN